MRNLESLKYTCLFGGGAIRGAGHVGVLKAFEELGITCERFGGSSVGSIIAALRAIGYSTDELAEIFLAVNFELFRDISFGFNTKFALSKGEVFLEWFRELIEKKFYGENYSKGHNPPVKFKDIDKELYAIWYEHAQSAAVKCFEYLDDNFPEEKEDFDKTLNKMFK